MEVGGVERDYPSVWRRAGGWLASFEHCLSIPCFLFFLFPFSRLSPSFHPLCLSLSFCYSSLPTLISHPSFLPSILLPPLPSTILQSQSRGAEIRTGLRLQEGEEGSWGARERKEGGRSRCLFLLPGRVHVTVCVSMWLSPHHLLVKALTGHM